MVVVGRCGERLAGRAAMVDRRKPKSERGSLHPPRVQRRACRLAGAFLSVHLHALLPAPQRRTQTCPPQKIIRGLALLPHRCCTCGKRLPGSQGVPQKPDAAMLASQGHLLGSNSPADGQAAPVAKSARQESPAPHDVGRLRQVPLPPQDDKGGMPRGEGAALEGRFVHARGRRQQEALPPGLASRARPCGQAPRQNVATVQRVCLSTRRG